MEIKDEQRKSKAKDRKDWISIEELKQHSLLFFFSFKW